MSLNARKAKSNAGHQQEPLEAGTYPNRLVRVVDLGVQEQQPYKGKPKPPMQMIHTTYEILDEFCVDEEGNIQKDKPRWVDEKFTLNNLDSDLANSTKRYYAIDPKEEKEGDWVALLGSPSNVVITATPGKGKNADRIYNNVASLSAMRGKEAEKAPELQNPTVSFTLDDPDMDVFMSLPKWLQDLIKKNEDFDGSLLEDRISKYKKAEGQADADNSADDASDDETEEDNGEW